MKEPKAIGALFLDADGVLWNDIGAGGIFKGKTSAIRNLKNLELVKFQNIFVVSNQTYAARNKMGYLKFKFFTNNFFKDLIKLKLIDDFAVCYHHPNATKKFLKKKCECRKPAPGLINILFQRYRIDIENSFLIGDRITDIQSGAAAGIELRFLLVNQRMLEINENLEVWPQQVCFLPLKNLNEVALFVGTFHEN
jgi:D-glycero-D-manno-heptose 1,7-bisphosphate phosphatase